MSNATLVLKKNNYKLTDNKGNEIKLSLSGGYSIDYSPPTIIEGRDYFSLYLTDTGSVFGNRFHGIVQIGIEDIKRMGCNILSVDIKNADKRIFPDLPWHDNQRKVYWISPEDEGVPPLCTLHPKMPSDCQASYDITNKVIIFSGKSISKNGYEKYSVGD